MNANVSLSNAILSVLEDGPALTSELRTLCDCDSSDDYHALRVALTWLYRCGKVTRKEHYGHNCTRSVFLWSSAEPASDGLSFITPMQRAFEYVKAHPGVSTTVARTELELSSATANYLLSSLCRRGLIQRTGRTVLNGNASTCWIAIAEYFTAHLRPAQASNGRQTDAVRVDRPIDPLIEPFSYWLAEDARTCIQPAFRALLAVTSSETVA